MTRTYLKASSSQLKNPSVKTTSSIRGGDLLESTASKDWRAKPLFDDSLDTPKIVFKRKPLKTLGNNQSLFKDDFPLSPDVTFKKTDNAENTAADDTFDKLFDNFKEKKVDPFDQLFENVDKKKTDPFDQLLNLSHEPQPLYCSLFSTPDLSEDISTDSSNQPGLFSSFSKQNLDVKTPILKKLKTNRKARVKKASVREVPRYRENVLSETLEVKVVFETDRDLLSAEYQPSPSQVSSLTLLPIREGRGLSALSVATSTPVLSSKSSLRNLSSELSPGPAMALSPVQDVLIEDDVFLKRVSTQSTTTQLTPSSRLDHLSSEDIFDPTPQKSFVNLSRGNPKFAGPAASLMNHIGWDFGMATIPIQSNNSNSSINSTAIQPGEVTVNLACVCGNNELSASMSMVIECDYCLKWFHTDCVQLNSSSIEELERDELDWFCSACIEEAVNNPDMTKNFTVCTPGRPEAVSITQGSSPAKVSALSIPSSNTSSSSPTSLPCSPYPVSICTSPVSLHHTSVASSLAFSLVKSPEQSFSLPTSPITTSLLSLTAQLEEQHLASNDAMQDVSIMFVKPAAPPTKRQNRKAVPVELEEVQLKAGKSWRRSLMNHTRRTVSQAGSRLGSLAEDSSLTVDNTDTSTFCSPHHFKQSFRLEPVLSTASVECLSPTPRKLPLRPQLTKTRSLARASRSSFCVVPATPRPDKLRGGRQSAMPLLSQTLLLTNKPESSGTLLLSETLLPQQKPSETLVDVGKLSDSITNARQLIDPLADLLSLSHTCEDHEQQLSPTSADPIQLSDTVSASLLSCAELTAVEKLLTACTRPDIAMFDSVYSPEYMEGSMKVGEGAFGEVFLLGSVGDDRPVLKVVPIDGDIPVNGEVQTSVEDMFSEVVISGSLSKLREDSSNMTAGFVEVRGCHVFRGEYPPQLLKLWDVFNTENESENDRPDNLPNDQKFIALEFNNGGRDLEKFVFKHGTQAFQAWKQVAHALAVAEEEMEFEHRDLHWGNVLVKETSDKYVSFSLGGDTYQVETGGVITTIIDFSLSRLTMDDVTIYNNLSEDPTLFNAKGKDQPGGDYQFDIYRKMKEVNKNSWEQFQPKTNILWLHYMLDKMTTEVYFSAKKTTKPHKSGMAKIRAMKSKLIEDFGSAAAWVRREGERVD